VLSTAAFEQWSGKVVLFLHNTSRVDGEPYPDLLYQMGGNAFPTVSFLDAGGRLLKQVGPVTSVEQLEQAWQDLQAWKTLRAEVGRGGAGADAEKRLFLLELQLGNRPFAEMQQRRDRLSLSEQEVRETQQPLVNLEFTEILRATPRDKQAEGGARFLPMFRARRLPTTTTETSFWQYLFAHAAAQKDVPLFEEILAFVKQERSEDARLRRYLPQIEEQLAQLKAKQGGG
jgi:hypothetical protein